MDYKIVGDPGQSDRRENPPHRVARQHHPRDIQYVGGSRFANRVAAAGGANRGEARGLAGVGNGILGEIISD